MKIQTNSPPKSPIKMELSGVTVSVEEKDSVIDGTLTSMKIFGNYYLRISQNKLTKDLHIVLAKNKNSMPKIPKWLQEEAKEAIKKAEKYWKELLIVEVKET